MGLAEGIALAGLALNVMVAVIGATWGLAKVRAAISEEIDGHRLRIDGELDNLGRSFGETATALREKIREVELFTRDTFMRRDDFSTFRDQLFADLKEMRAELIGRLDRMEIKMDEP
jgi:hypothetical protein